MQNVKKNITLSIVSQMISLLGSFLIAFIVPKFITELSYAKWQTYILYMGYVGLFHFGLLDGIVLRYSQCNYDELDKPIIRFQLLSLLVITIISACIIGIVGVACLHLEKIMVLFISIGVIVRNIQTYTTYLLRITNKITAFTKMMIIRTTMYVLSVFIFIFYGINKYYIICIMDILADVISTIYGASKIRDLFSGKICEISIGKNELISNIKAGIFLMIANLTSEMLIACSKTIIQCNWDELIFGKVIFSFSIASLFLTFASSVSFVLFPTIKRLDKEQLPIVYYNAREIISSLMCTSLILYFPVIYLIKLWLPNYVLSLEFTKILLPIIIFTAKTYLLTNNYLKAYRKEKMMSFINICFLAFTIFGNLIICSKKK